MSDYTVPYKQQISIEKVNQILNESDYGIYTINKTDIHYQSFHKLKASIKDSLKDEQKTSVVGSLPTYESIQIEEPRYFYYKLVWLTKEYLDNKGFKFPITIKDTKKSNKWSVHPGSSRQLVIHYFYNQPTIDVLYHNLNNLELQPVTIFKKYKDIIDNFEIQQNKIDVIIKYKNDGIELHLDTLSEPMIIKKIEKKIRKFFKRTRIKSNINLKKFGYNSPFHPQNTVRVHFSKKTDEVVLKAFLLLPLQIDYKDSDLEINVSSD
jgi:hypothetical protein